MVIATPYPVFTMNDKKSRIYFLIIYGYTSYFYEEICSLLVLVLWMPSEISKTQSDV